MNRREAIVVGRMSGREETRDMRVKAVGRCAGNENGRQAKGLKEEVSHQNR